jgi:hypothetical protein
MGGRIEEGRLIERFGLRNDQSDQIKDVLPGHEGHMDGVAEDIRPFAETMLCRFRSGVSLM